MTENSKTRSNDEWLEALAKGEAADDLRAYIQGGLRKAFAGRGNVNDADLEDFTQDALILIMEKLETFRGDSRFTTWAMSVAIRVAYGALRKRNNRSTLLAEIQKDGTWQSPIGQAGGAKPGEMANRSDLLEKLHHAIQHDLSDRQRQAILEELAGLPTQSIAKRLEITPNTLYKLHHDARKKLQKSLLKAGITENDVRHELAEASKA